MPDNVSVFDTILGGNKTYITAGIGIVIDSLATFGVWSPTPKEITEVNGLVVLVAVIFIRSGIKTHFENLLKEILTVKSRQAEASPAPTPMPTTIST